MIQPWIGVTAYLYTRDHSVTHRCSISHQHPLLQKWSQLSELLGWFDMIAKTDSTGSLTFAASMSKEQRAQIHQ
jgi:hypothetical protein